MIGLIATRMRRVRIHLLDMHLPKYDGHEILKHLRSTRF